jgi:hypothetical protein
MTNFVTEFLPTQGYHDIHDRGDGTWIALNRLMFHYSMLVGTIGDETGYDDRWCMGNYAMALESLNEWKSRGYHGEPLNWHRHPKTSRRRVDGNPLRETIED